MNPEHGEPGHVCPSQWPNGQFSLIEGLPGEDPLHLTMQSLEAEMEAMGWDIRPKMFMMVNVPDVAEGTDVQGAIEFIMPEPWYEAPNHVGPTFLAWLRDYPPARAGVRRYMSNLPGFIGMILFAEGWTAKMPPEGHPDREAWNQARMAGGFHLLSWREEERFGIACMLDGRRLMISRKRGEFPQMREPGVNVVEVGGQMAATLMETCQEIEMIRWEMP